MDPSTPRQLPADTPLDMRQLVAWAQARGLSMDDPIVEAHALRIRVFDPTTFAVSMRHPTPAAHHRIMLDNIARVVRDRTVNVVDINAPPGAAKTMTLAVSIAWAMALDPAAEHILVCNSEELAERTARKVRALVSSDNWKALAHYSGLVTPMEIIPVPTRRDLEIDGATRAAARFSLNKGGGLLAVGISSTLLGFRVTGTLWLDDLVRGYEEAASDTRMEKLKAFLLGDAFTRMSGRFSCVHIGQRLGFNDTTGILGRHFAEIPEVVYRNLILRLVCEPDDPHEPPELNRKPGDVLWPEMFHGALLANAKASGALVWKTRYQQHPGAEQTAWATEELLLHDADLTGRDMQCFLAGDMSGGSQDGDAGVLAVVGARRDRKTRELHMHVLEVWRGFVNPDEFLSQAVRMSGTWRTTTWIFESDAYARSLRSFAANRVRVSGCPVKIELLSVAGSKIDRASSLRGMLWAGQLHLPPRGYSEASDRMRFELLNFGRLTGVAVDDTVDTLAVVARKIGIEGYYPQPRDRKVYNLNGEQILEPEPATPEDRLMREGETPAEYLKRRHEQTLAELARQNHAVYYKGRIHMIMDGVDEIGRDYDGDDHDRMTIW